MKNFKLMKKTQIILIAAVLATIGFSSCTKYTNRIKGTGPAVEQTYDLPPISSVALNIDANVILTHGDSQEVRIVGQQNILNNIERFVNTDGLWNIGYFNSVTSHSGVTIHITTINLNYASISGSGNIESSTIFPDTTTMVFLKISGSGSINIGINTHILQSDISGSGKIIVSGFAHEHTVNVSGSGDIRAFGLNTFNTYLKISGSGNSEVMVENLLDVNISGSGNVYYMGYPAINLNISGSGGVFSRN